MTEEHRTHEGGNPLESSVNLLVKLGSIAVHAMDAMALLPVKRGSSE